MSGIPKVYAVQFSKPLRIHSYGMQNPMQLSVKVKGNGSARVFPENTKFFNGMIDSLGSNVELFVSSPIKKPPSIIAEIYC